MLGRIVQRAPVRLFPDSFMASPDVSPAEIAAAVGYVDEEDELFEVSVSVMGHFDPGLSAFVNPRILPRSGSPIYLAPSEMLSEVLSRRKVGERGSAHVGWLLSRDQGEVAVALDVNEFTSTHLSIIAGTGSGKSYLAGVTIEELMKPYNKGCVLIADPARRVLHPGGDAERRPFLRGRLPAQGAHLQAAAGKGSHFKSDPG